MTDVYIEIQTKKIELYSATMQIHAHFTGLRYLMFHWPVLSAIVGIGTNLLMIIFVLLMSWYHLFYSEGSAYQYTKNIRERFASIAESEKIELKKQQAEGELFSNLRNCKNTHLTSSLFYCKCALMFTVLKQSNRLT